MADSGLLAGIQAEVIGTAADSRGALAGIQAEVIATSADSRGGLAGIQAEVIATSAESRGGLAGIWAEVIVAGYGGGRRGGVIGGDRLEIMVPIVGEGLRRRI